MLGVNYTFIACDVIWCKFNEEGDCKPPQDEQLDRRLRIKKGVCMTFRGIKPHNRYKK